MFDLFSRKKEENLPTSALNIRKELVTLIILDGLGIHPDPLGNSVLQAKTPFLDTIWTKGHSTLLHASGVHVGLPELEPGNSEVGHLNIGSGQIVYQSLPRINDAISNGKFQENPELKAALDYAKENGVDFHMMGILSTGGVHGHIDHLFALLDICKREGINPYIHAFLDGRDTGLTDGYYFLSKLINRINEVGVGRLASLSGRFYAMDRDKRWDRTEMAYDAMLGHGRRIATDPFQIVQEAYKNDENDQIFVPTTLVDKEGEPIGAIKDRDVLLFYNFREDRARQITKAFVIDEANFDGFKRKVFHKDLYYLAMTGYGDGLDNHVIFPPKKIEASLARVIANQGWNQFHISETEKFMHVTYFLNGGIEEPHPGEEFFSVPSPKVFDYSQTPEMSAAITRDELVKRINNNAENRYAFTVINIVNPDMLGHTGNLQAAVTGNQFVDDCVRDIVTATVKHNGAAIIIADHGNCETMIDRETGKIDTYHNINPVPFILVDNEEQLLAGVNETPIRLGEGRDVPTSGLLADVAPTILAILGVEPPEEMTGLNLMNVL
ncbi:MAG: 2,3-bisphosphoglycerate-independent phosphoglycerate mutase [Candidatus Dojkabacteria bacterium]|nr:MAG: 2,3-bisphosphoglycerate-independent phosphoglycerate mutase [Candidatus Dojkabacteria bacterium]